MLLTRSVQRQLHATTRVSLRKHASPACFGLGVTRCREQMWDLELGATADIGSALQHKIGASGL